MARIEYFNDGVQVDASILAQAFAISTEGLRLGMREGAITSRFEQGEGEEAGKVRLTFFSADRRVRMIADEQGSVLRMQCRGLAGAPATFTRYTEPGGRNFRGLPCCRRVRRRPPSAPSCASRRGLVRHLPCE